MVELIPIIVNEKTKILVDKHLIGAYFIRIWCKAKAKDKLFQVINNQNILIHRTDKVDLKKSNKFVLKRE